MTATLKAGFFYNRPILQGGQRRSHTAFEKGMAETATTFIEKQAGPVDLFGWSMGGMVALTLALTRPDIIRGNRM
jgi:pimeloyl-ACP methyl ester carboxylesterase